MERPRTGSRAGVRADGEPSQIWVRFAIAGAALIAVAGVLTTCTDGRSSGSTSSPDSVYAASTVSDDVIARWYDGTHDVRQRIADDVAEIRARLSAQDGNALRPACTTLADDVTEARALTSGPDTAAQNLFDAGLDGYGDGVTACGNLFDGTQLSVDVLQEQIRKGLTTGDEQWAALAARLSLPMATAAAVPPSEAETSTPPDAATPGAPASTPGATRPTPVRTTPPPTAPRTGPPPATTTPAPPPATTASPTTPTPPMDETTPATKPPLPTLPGGG
ncbi:hypothetical protein [Pseudofrankia sp. BMG5.37]|uniref:hypothetical protein n=1 Tax=Pseudofrankia sp. BMG5.37 TaxID=3050035 RepID=UPI0028951D39|nr:hypothetical protein [Pseudofrankia sp. BMG5.37]MDT3444972.1 hypothetical protein [Pseudofrankia sp. BMG5.37]